MIIIAHPAKPIIVRHATSVLDRLTTRIGTHVLPVTTVMITVAAAELRQEMTEEIIGKEIKDIIVIKSEITVVEMITAADTIVSHLDIASTMDVTIIKEIIEIAESAQILDHATSQVIAIQSFHMFMLSITVM